MVGLANTLRAQSVDEVIGHFRESLSTRHSFHAQVHARRQEPNSPDMDVVKATWLVAGESQRRTETIWTKRSADTPIGTLHQDVQLTPLEWRLLRNLDRDHPPSLPMKPTLEDTAFHRIAGYVQPPADRPARGYHASPTSSYLLMTVDFQTSVLDHLEEHRQECVASEHEGLPSIVVPAPADPYGEAYRISFDPAAGWSVRKKELLDSEGVVWAYTVNEFLAEGGCYLPTQVEGTSRIGTRTRITAEYSRVNEPIPDSEFIINFPEGCRVYAPEDKVYIWGKDAPAQTFTEEELEAWEAGIALAELAAARSVRRPGLSSFWIYSNVVLITLILGLSFWRSRLERKT